LLAGSSTTVPSCDRLVESFDAFAELSLVAYPDGLRNLSEHLPFPKYRLWHKACGCSAWFVLVEEKRYARNHFDRRYDFAAKSLTGLQPSNPPAPVSVRLADGCDAS
jgi:hypothetical protein